jgi:ribonucleoside-diphosphate reductase alpha chain
LGLLGFHSYLQSKSIAADSFEARMVNAKIFKHLHDEANRASRFLAEWLGEPEWMAGTGKRNSHLIAIAPNTSSAFMAGAKSEGVQFMVANIFQQKIAKVGSVERINPELLKILRERGFDTEEIMESISYNKGSVQHLDNKILTEHEKNVFKTAYEINQKLIIDLAEQRQQWIDQGQSLNLFFDANEDEAWIHEVHKHAFQQTRLKSLYYVRTQAGISADKDDTCKACEG